MPPRRSISRDRGANDSGAPVAGSFRDRQIREREQREYEMAFRARPREREGGSRSLARTASFSSDYYRDSDPSGSAEEGEEKPVENLPTPSEKSVESHAGTPSDAGSTDRDIARAADSHSKISPPPSAPSPPSKPSSGDILVQKEPKPSIAKDDGDETKQEMQVSSVDNGVDVAQTISTTGSTEGMEIDELGSKQADELASSVKPDEIVLEKASSAEIEKQQKSLLTTEEHAKPIEDGSKILAGDQKVDNNGEDTRNDTTGVNDLPNLVKTSVSTSTPIPPSDGVTTEASKNVVTTLKSEESLQDRPTSSEKHVVVVNKATDVTEREVAKQKKPYTSPKDVIKDSGTAEDITKSSDRAESDDIDMEAACSKPGDPANTSELVVHQKVFAEDEQMNDANAGDTSSVDVSINRESDQSASSNMPNTKFPEDEAPITSAVVTSHGERAAVYSDNDIEEGEMVATNDQKGSPMVASVDTPDVKLDKSAQNNDKNLEQNALRASPAPAQDTQPRSAGSTGTDSPADTNAESRQATSKSPSSSNVLSLIKRDRSDGEQGGQIDMGGKSLERGDPASTSLDKSRPVLDRRASFSVVPERTNQSAQFSQEACRQISSLSTKVTSLNSHISLDSNTEGRRRTYHDELKKKDAVKRELLRAGSVDSMIDRNLHQSGVMERSKVIKASSASASNSPSLRSVSSGSDPALPDIPLPNNGQARNNSSPFVVGEGTPTKRQRPRLGWGQGLVAASPPQPAKRPRIGWGQGLVQQPKDATAEEKTPDSVESANKDVSVSVDAESVSSANEAIRSQSQSEQDPGIAKSEVSVSKTAEINSSDGIVPQTVEEKTSLDHAKEDLPTNVIGMNEKTETVTAVLSTNDENDQNKLDEDEDTTETPSKEEILSTIDTLDSDITDVKKQIEALQKTIKEDVKPEDSSCPVTMEIEPTSQQLSTDRANDGDAIASKSLSDDSPASPLSNSQLASGRHIITSPAKVAVDSRFVEVLAGIFSENLRKTAAANDQLPKRLEQGRLATKIYHQPSDYSFYQTNIDCGDALADKVRLKVRARNRTRHEYVKKLARDYVDLKKSWKLRVKKMEKDRKRQDKMRLKQLQKQKLKGINEGGPVRTTNTNHQSPHVQQLVAAEKAAEAEGTTVRTSSRLTNNSSGDLDNNDLEKIEQAKAQALIDQEVRRKRLKNALSTVIPDMLITSAERQQRYFTRFVNGQSCMADGLVTDWKQKEKAEMKVNPWNDLEKCIYIDKFLQFPKNFPRISSFLRNKTTGDVIAFYYKTKKVADYKALLREQQLRRRGAGSKNTWSCWNLSACAAICLGVQFPEHVAKLLLHPSNFRSHQASDNILNSAGAQRLLKKSGAKRDKESESASSDATESPRQGLSALEMVKGPDHTPTVRSEDGVQLDDVISSADADISDEEKFNLYTQQLEQFIAGQQQPFLMDYASLLTDNSYSTGYEVSTLTIEERLKKYPVPSKELESSSTVSSGSGVLNSAGMSQDANRGKQLSITSGVGGNVKNGGSHMTKKELKQQRKLKKMQDEAAAASAFAVGSSQPLNVGGNHSRKKSAVASTANVSPGSRSNPRIAIPDDKTAQNSKKSNRAGGTPASRRNSHHVQASTTSASPKLTLALSPGAAALAGATGATTGGASLKKSASGNITPHLSGKALSPAANVTAGSSAAAPVAAPTKRVVQKWTEAEKADFLKYFSQYGKDWATLTENIPTKTAAQIKNYYQNYKNRLNLQDILKRRIEKAAASSGKGGPATAGGSNAASPRSAAAGLMSGTLRPMGPAVELSGIPTSMAGGASMAMNANDNMSFQAALNAAQPGMHGVNVLSELSTTQFGMQTQQDQQQSRDMMNPANSERYLKLLNMQHQLQLMQFQQQQKSQTMATESANTGSNGSPYHEGQVAAANAQRLYQYSRHQAVQQQQGAPQHLPMQALQQMGMPSHSQVPTHSQMMQLPMQQQGRASFAEMGHPGNMYHPMAQMQTQHPQAVHVSGHMSMSPTSAAQYDRNSSRSTNAEGGVERTRTNIGNASGMIGHRDISQRAMLNAPTMNKASGANVSEAPRAASTNSPGRPPMGPPRSMMAETSRPPELESRQTTWQSAAMASSTSSGSASAKAEGSSSDAASSVDQSSTPKGREALAPPAPPPVQPVRSRMSFSSILNESESPRDDGTPRGNGSMVIKEQESPRSEQQQSQQGQPQQPQQQQLRLDQVRSMPPSSVAELARSPVAPSPTAQLLPRRASAPAPAQSRMGFLLNNVSSPDNRTSNAGRQSPLVQQQQQQLQRQMQAARYYEANTSSADNRAQPSRGSIASMVSEIPTSATMSMAMARSSPAEKMPSTSGIGGYSAASAQMQVGLSRSGSVSSTSSAISSNATPSGSAHGQQQQMWSYAPQMRFEEAELLRRAQRAEEEAARAAAAAAAAARALQEAQQARQEAMNMAANMARYNSAMQQQTQQQQQVQQQQQQAQQYQKYQQQLQHHHQMQQHDYHQQHQAQQLHQQQMQHQALHHHLQMMQQQQQSQQPPRGPQPDR